MIKKNSHWQRRERERVGKKKVAVEPLQQHPLSTAWFTNSLASCIVACVTLRISQGENGKMENQMSKEDRRCHHVIVTILITQGFLLRRKSCCFKVLSFLDYFIAVKKSGSTRWAWAMNDDDLKNTIIWERNSTWLSHVMISNIFHFIILFAFVVDC
jgi:hypothetical protein